MGGCCCSSRKPQLHGTPVFYYCPPTSEEHESLTSHDSVLSSSGVFIDLNLLDMSVPDTYQSPPTPIPYDVLLGRPQSTRDCDVTGGNHLEKPNCMDLSPIKETGFPPCPKKGESQLLKSNTTIPVPDLEEEEDVCPTCLEEYDQENPKMVTKCNHHFHLSCILEWMERCDTCPICDQKMIYEAL